MSDNHNTAIGAILSLADWRLQMAALYQQVSTSDRLADIWPYFISERTRLYDTHPQSPLQKGNSMAFFDYDPAFYFEVALRPLSASSVHKADGGKDGMIDFNAVAVTDGLAASLGAELVIYQMAHYGGGLFLPFGDATNGGASYGGGRYLIDSAKSAWLGMAQERIRLDFNFAYFPSCAHDSQYLCPLSPAENRLPNAIEVGEKWA